MLAKDIATFLKYQLKIIFRSNFWAALLVAMLIPLAVNYPLFIEEDLRLYWAVKMNEMFYPVLGIILFSNMISQEWDRKTEALWLSKSLPRYAVLTGRVVIGTAYLSIILLISMTLQYFLYVRFDIARMMLTLLSPALYLGVLGLAAGTLMQNTLLGILVPTFYWVMEITTKGQYTGILALFARATHPLCLTETCVDYVQGAAWIPAKFILLAFSGILLFLSGFSLTTKGRKLIPQKARR